MSIVCAGDVGPHALTHSGQTATASCRLPLLPVNHSFHHDRFSQQNRPFAGYFTTLTQRTSKSHHFGGDSPTTTYQLVDERKVFVSNYTYKRATRGSCRLQLGSFLAEMVVEIA